jgi:hypothetical protein
MNAAKQQPTEELIGLLSAELQAVKPLQPPVTRALLWLIGIAVVTTPAVLILADLSVFAARNNDVQFTLEMAATLLTGIVAVVAAFYLTIPGRSERWLYAPLAPLSLWLGTSGLGCLRNGLGHVNMDCLYFVLAVSVPLAVILFAVLRVARPIAPLRVALMGSLGVAGIAAFLLQFFHPFDITVIDLGIHLVTIAAIMGAAATFGRRALTTDSVSLVTQLSAPTVDR